MLKLGWETTSKRLERGMSSGRPDLFGYLVGEDQKEKSPINMHELDADVRSVIVAGSDTTASTLAFAIEYLARYPAIMKQLQDEVEPFRGKDVNPQELVNLPILNALINETLRLRPPVPSKSQRMVGTEGMSLLGRWLPPGTVVSILLLRHSTRSSLFCTRPRRLPSGSMAEVR